jgi:glycosyltransferase involved in cell wall biosynthesis
MSGLRIGINTTCAVAGGAITHLRNLLPPMLEQAGQDRIVVIGDASMRDRLQPPSGIEWVEITKASGGLAGRIFRENFEIPRLVRQHEIDVLFHPGNFAVFRSPVPQVILIHNLAPYLKEVAEGESPYQRLRLVLLRLLTRSSLPRVSRTIFISKWGRELVLEGKATDEVQTPVIPFGAEHGGVERDSTVLKHWNLEPDRYVLTVSHLYLYKRIEKLIRAWVELGERVAEWPLLIVGEPFDANYARSLEALARESIAPVIFTGSLDAQALVPLMQQTRAFIFTSEAENLPITLLEAMSAGCPIITNRYCSMPETCLDAALYADPATAENYQSHLETILWDDSLRAAMRAKSQNRAQAFRWEKTAQLTLEVMRGAARERLR